MFHTQPEDKAVVVEIARGLVKDHTELENITRTLREILEPVMPGMTVEEAELRQQLSTTFLIRQRRHLYAEEALVHPLVNEMLTSS